MIKNLLSEDGLVIYKVEIHPDKPTKLICIPPLDELPPKIIYPTKCSDPSESRIEKIPFKDWWENKIIDDKQGRTYSRGELILDVCHKDGGAHIEAKIKEKYVNLKTKHHLKPMGHHGGIIAPSNIVSANIRQITHEILKTLKDEFPEFFEENEHYEIKSVETLEELNHNGWILLNENRIVEAKEYFLKSLKINSNNPFDTF